MDFEFDPAKDKANKQKHGLSFSIFSEIDKDSVFFSEDIRKNYGETRFIVTGLINGRLHVAVLTLRENTYRIISLRKANKREEKAHAKKRNH